MFPVTSVFVKSTCAPFLETQCGLKAQKSLAYPNRREISGPADEVLPYPAAWGHPEPMSLDKSDQARYNWALPRECFR